MKLLVNKRWTIFCMKVHQSQVFAILKLVVMNLQQTNISRSFDKIYFFRFQKADDIFFCRDDMHLLDSGFFSLWHQQHNLASWNYFLASNEVFCVFKKTSYCFREYTYFSPVKTPLASWCDGTHTIDCWETLSRLG